MIPQEDHWYDRLEQFETLDEWASLEYARGVEEGNDDAIENMEFDKRRERDEASTFNNGGGI